MTSYSTVPPWNPAPTRFRAKSSDRGIAPASRIAHYGVSLELLKLRPGSCPALGWSQPAGALDHLAGEVEHLVKAGEQCEGVHERLVRTGLGEALELVG